MKENDDYKHIVLEINAHKYKVSLRLSLKDANFVIKHKNEYSNNYNILVAKLIINHIIDQDNVPSIEFVASDSGILTEYINSIVNEDIHLSESYEKMSEYQDICQRFVMSIIDMLMDATLPIADSIPQMDSSWMRNIVETAVGTSNQIGSVAPNLADAAKESFSNIQEIVFMIQQAMEPIEQMSKVVSETLSGFVSQLSSLFELIKMPDISEEQKEELRFNFEAWGKCGWTSMPNSDLTIFENAPTDIKDANNKIKIWCKKEDVEILFEFLHSAEGVNKTDLEEAISLYYSQQYKPCAMLLFSLIDAKLIRMQRKEDRDIKTKRRNSGAKAIKKIKQRIELEQDINETFYLLLLFVNLFACIEVFFEDAKDFKKQPTLINRNFLQHGMLTRRVKKRDCIQLFLLYYNFLEFVGIMNN